MLKTFNMAIPSKAILAPNIPHIDAFTSLQGSRRRRQRSEAEVRGEGWRRRSEVGGGERRRGSEAEVGGGCRRRKSEAEVGGGCRRRRSMCESESCGVVVLVAAVGGGGMQPCKFVEVGGRWKSVIHHTWKLCKTQHKLRKVSRSSTVKSSMA